jgi:hypothetical protein
MLKAIPKHWFSWDFTISEASSSQALAEITVSWWREKGVLTVQGTSYRVYREGLGRGAFILESGASVLARAEKPSALRRSFIIEQSGTQYTLCAKSVFRRELLLLNDSTQVGSISPEGVFTRRASVALPEELPLVVQVFIVWLAVILWKRESDSAGAAACLVVAAGAT